MVCSSVSVMLSKREVQMAYRDLLAKKVEIVFAIGEILRGGRELGFQERVGFGKRIGQHNIGSKPEVHFFGIGNVSFGVEGIVELKGCLDGIGIRLDRFGRSARLIVGGWKHGSLTSLIFRKRTASKVLWISGIFSLRPFARRWVLTSMSWYLLA